MNDALNEVVRRAVAGYVALDPTRIRPDHRLQRDLGLHPLDIAMVMLDIEEMEQTELPIDHLDGVETVSDLIHLLRAAKDAESEDGADRKMVREHLPVSRSGAIRIVDLAPDLDKERAVGQRAKRRAR